MAGSGAVLRTLAARCVHRDCQEGAVAVVESSAVSDAGRPADLRSDVDCNVVWLRGEHDVSTSVADSEALARAIALNDSNVTVDLSEVGFMDGSTIRTLIRAHAFLDARSRSLTLRSPSRCAALVIRVTGLDDLVAVRPGPREP
jgi:anti-anti-sigma factor